MTEQVPQTNAYEDLTCTECNYGAVDNAGQCVIDAEHIALSWTRIIPQIDGYYWRRTLVRTEIVERFCGLFYVEDSRFALTPDQIRDRGGEFLGPLTPQGFERLLGLRKGKSND